MSKNFDPYEDGDLYESLTGGFEIGRLSDSTDVRGNLLKESESIQGQLRGVLVGTQYTNTVTIKLKKRYTAPPYVSLYLQTEGDEPYIERLPAFTLVYNSSTLFYDITRVVEYVVYADKIEVTARSTSNFEYTFYGIVYK